MHVRKGTAEDLAGIAAIQRSAPEAAQWDCAGYELLVADSYTVITGFLVWRSVAPDEAEILNLAVAPLFRRQGVGRALIGALPAGNYFLEVRESNVAAQSLYRSAGFSIAGVRYGYYSDPAETGIVMRLQAGMQDPDDVVRIPITDTFDLHSVPPGDVEGVTEAYLEEAFRMGLAALRIIHGRGIGVQRETVRRVLSRTPFIESFQDAPAEAGGWGATVVTLRPNESRAKQT